MKRSINAPTLSSWKTSLMQLPSLSLKPNVKCVEASARMAASAVMESACVVTGLQVPSAMKKRRVLMLN